MRWIFWGWRLLLTRPLVSPTLQENPFKSESLTWKNKKDKRGFWQEEEDDDGTCGNSEEFSVLWTSESCFTYVITPPLPYFQIVLFFSNSECIQNQPNQCWWQAWTESRNMCGGKENLDSGFFHLFLNRGIIVQVARQDWRRSLWLKGNTARLCRNLIHQSNAALDLQSSVSKGKQADLCITSKHWTTVVSSAAISPINSNSCCTLSL